MHVMYIKNNEAVAHHIEAIISVKVRLERGTYTYKDRLRPDLTKATFTHNKR